MRPVRTAALLGGLLLVMVCAVQAESGEQVSRVHPLGMAPWQDTYDLVRGLLTPEGRAVLDEGHNSIIVRDVAEVQERVAALLTKVQGPLRSVRIETRIIDAGTGDEASVSTTGQLLLPTPVSSSAGTLYFESGGGRNITSREASQEFLVVSGGSATVSVGREIPYQNWFFSYGRRHGVIGGDVQWRDVGSRVSVSPVVVDGGRKVRMRITPEFEYGTGAGGRRHKRMSVVSFAGAATERVVDSGEVVRFGDAEDVEEFHRRFLTGYDRQRRTRRVVLILRATVVDGAPD